MQISLCDCVCGQMLNMLVERYVVERGRVDKVQPTAAAGWLVRVFSGFQGFPLIYSLAGRSIAATGFHSLLHG